MRFVLKYFLLFTIIFSSDFSFSQSDNLQLDSLINILKTAKEDTNKVNILAKIGEICAEEDILKYAVPALKLSEKLNFKKEIANSLNNIGYFYSGRGESEKALQNYVRALKIQEEIGDEEGKAGTLNNMAVIYTYQGQVEKALESYALSLSIEEKINDEAGTSVTLSNIGGIYYTQKQTNKALEYYLRSLKIREIINEKTGIANSLNNIAIIYSEQGKNDQALKYYTRALKLCEETGEKQGIATCLIGIANIYSDMGLKEKTLEYYFHSLKISEELEDNLSIAHCLNNIGSIYHIQKKYGPAEEYCLRSLQLAQQGGYPEKIRNASEVLIRIYKETVNYKKAVGMFKIFKQMSDSLNNKETQKASVRKQMQYEFEKKEALAKAEQDKKDLISLEELKQQTLQRNYFITGFALVLLLAGFIFRSYLQKRKDNEIITAKKLEIERQKDFIEEKQKEILDSIHYAKLIQRALITSEMYFEKNLNRLMK